MWETQVAVKAELEPERDTISKISGDNFKLVSEALELSHKVYSLLYGNTTEKTEAGNSSVNSLYDDLKVQKAMLDEICCMLKSVVDRF